MSLMDALCTIISSSLWFMACLVFFLSVWCWVVMRQEWVVLGVAPVSRTGAMDFRGLDLGTKMIGRGSG